MNDQLDLLIIGAGPIGMACAIEAEKTGLSYVVIEKGVLVNSLFHFPTNMTFFSTSNLLEIGDVPFISHTEKPTRREALEYYRRVWQSWDLKINLYEAVTEVESRGDVYQVTTSKQVYHARHLIVATGFYGKSVQMNVPGESLPKVRHYYEEAHPYIGQRVLVVGAANSACDVALETYLKGAEVAMVIRSSEIYPRVKYWIRPNIENRIKEGSIKAYFNSTIKEIKEKEVVIDTPEGEVTLANDFVLAMTGYQPDYSLLEKVGIQHQDDEYHTPIFNEDTLETNMPRVYLAGVICGGLKTNKLFIENSRVHAEIIVQHILQGKSVPSH
ncbi:MAG: YpdA family putative bacillithiol disulfide reductase [Saprospiraceae bacterium]|nr:YpdA family putative bacillithiol disulfide reductase [Saprospiraceae bacterium]